MLCLLHISGNEFSLIGRYLQNSLFITSFLFFVAHHSTTLHAHFGSGTPDSYAHKWAVRLLCFEPLHNYSSTRYGYPASRTQPLLTPSLSRVSMLRFNIIGSRSLARLSCTGYRATCPISGFQPSWIGVSVRMLAFRAVFARGHVRDPCRLKSCPSCPPVGVRVSSSDTRTRRWPMLLVFSVFYQLLFVLPCGTINISNSGNTPGKPLENGHFPIAKMMRFRAPIIERDETGGSKNPIPKDFQRIFHWLLNFTTSLSQNPRILDTLKIRPLIISFSCLLLFSSHPSNPIQYN